MGFRLPLVEAVVTRFASRSVADTAGRETAIVEIHVPRRLQSIVIWSAADEAFCAACDERR